MEELGSSWRKASYSDNGGNCVEVGQSADAVLVRDTTRRDGATLTVPADAWRRLTAEIKQTRLALAQNPSPLFGAVSRLRLPRLHVSGPSPGNAP
jgi:hypothetical protein